MKASNHQIFEYIFKYSNLKHGEPAKDQFSGKIYHKRVATSYYYPSIKIVYDLAILFPVSIEELVIFDAYIDY
jgi:hypothetical protein